MNRLVKLELLKLRTTPALYVTFGAAFVLAVASAVTNLLLTVQPGAAPFGSAAHVEHVLTQPSAAVSMAMFIFGVLVVAGEYRNRTIIGTFLAETRRGRVLVAKLLTVGVLGAALGAVTYVVTLAVVVPLYAHRGVSDLHLDATRLGLGTVLSGAGFALLGVALGALTRNTVGAIVGGLIWIQLIEVSILENAFPALGKWLPVGASQGLTSLHASAQVLPQGVAAVVLVGWAAALVALAIRISVRRELR